MKMIERKLSAIDIPNYTLGQEIFNGISHFLGIPLGLIVISLSFDLKFLIGIDTISFIGLLIYGLSLVALYLVSGLYHIETPRKEKSKKVKRVLDHCTIYFLIAGTYTPICLFINQTNQIGLIVLILEWIMAVIGALLNLIDFNNKVVKGISMFLYLGLGWLVLFSGAFTYLPISPFAFILTGGILYTIGSITYGIGHKNLNFHSIFHVFVLLGSLFQCIGVLMLFF